MTLKGKLRAIIAVAATGQIILAALWLINQHNQLLSERTRQTQLLVETAYAVAAEQYRLAEAGKCSNEEAQKNAMQIIGNMRYGDNNYFWITDTTPRMIMHPMKPEMDGKELTSVKDGDGNPLFVNLVQAARAPEGGYVRYRWPKPGSDKPVPKLSYAKTFAPWGWVIASGNYIEDIDAVWKKVALIANGVGFTSLIVLLILSTQTIRSILSRFKEIVNRIMDVAKGHGDLTQHIEITTNDEISQLAHAFNAFIDRLKDVLRQVSGNTQDLAQASEEISGVMRELTQNAGAQQLQTEQVVAAMQEMAAAVASVSDNAARAATASNTAVETASSGGQIVEETLSTMRSIASSVEDTATCVRELGQRSSEIGRITSVIEEIANQTNLLALNAAIEAARAGEHGRGFAVVASEVRRLAERTAQATSEIASTIHLVQEETGKAVTTMDNATQQVELGVTAASQAGETLHGIIETSKQAGALVSQIAVSANEQVSAVQQINLSIDEIARITNSAVDGTKQTSGALDELAHLAQGLRSLVGQFRLDAEDHPAAQVKREHKLAA